VPLTFSDVKALYACCEHEASPAAIAAPELSRLRDAIEAAIVAFHHSAFVKLSTRRYEPVSMRI
jgi:hypothetical protein